MLGEIESISNEQTTSLLSGGTKQRDFNTQLERFLHGTNDNGIAEEEQGRNEVYHDGVSTINEGIIADGGDEDKRSIILITKADYKKLSVLICILIFYSAIILGWNTSDHENRIIEGEVGIACVTPCKGNPKTRDFFYGHNKFSNDDVIEIQAYVDPTPAQDVDLKVNIVSSHSGRKFIEKTITFGPVDNEERTYFEETVYASDLKYPESTHVLYAYSSKAIDLTFDLNANVLNEVAKYSVIIAAVLLVIVYALILLEPIHTSLIAVFGALNALALLYWINGDIVMEIGGVMMFVEWATIGLLFGMMVSFILYFMVYSILKISLIM